MIGSFAGALMIPFRIFWTSSMRAATTFRTMTLTTRLKGHIGTGVH
jgi:hypothetical protein